MRNLRTPGTRHQGLQLFRHGRIQIAHESNDSAYQLDDPVHGHPLLSVERGLHAQKLCLGEKRRKRVVELVLDEPSQPL